MSNCGSSINIRIHNTDYCSYCMCNILIYPHLTDEIIKSETKNKFFAGELRDRVFKSYTKRRRFDIKWILKNTQNKGVVI